MKLSGRQKRALEKITGETWDSFHPEAVKAYFDLTDKGKKPSGLSQEMKGDFERLYFSHKHHGWLVKEWARDFQRGLLFLSDFWDYPESFIEHAFEIYENTVGFVPSCYRNHPRTPTRYRLAI